MKKAQWTKKFDDAKCPEIVVTLPLEKTVCGEHCKELILNPEPPITLCDYATHLPEC